MREAEAIELLKKLEIGVQRCRSVMLEQFGITDENDDSKAEMRVLRDLHSWLFGDKCVLIPLARLNARIAAGEPLAAIDFYNMMWIVHRTPVLQLWPVTIGAKWTFPEPTPRILSDWQPTNKEQS